MPFRDRREAGQRLAQALPVYDDAVVLGLPRGGVIVAAEVAAALRAPLDVLVVRKLGHPRQPELGVGAIGEGGVRVVNRRLVAETGVQPDELERVARAEHAELERRVAAYRDGHPAIEVQGRTVIVVDDGIATGSTVRAAIHVLRARGAGRVVVAVPVAPPRTVDDLRQMADDVVCLETPEHFMAIGEWFHDFTQTRDEEVVTALARAAGRSSPAAGLPAEEVRIPVDGRQLPGELVIPPGGHGVVIFAHGSGSSRLSPRNRAVASVLNEAGLATLLFDLLDEAEAADPGNVFDVPLLARRLAAAHEWVNAHPTLAGQPIAYFGASTGAAAALLAASDDDGLPVAAVVSRGGRPDLAGRALADVRAPTLLVVGGDDRQVLELNRQALDGLAGEKRLAVVPGAGHLFEEPGTLDEVATLARDWLLGHLVGAGARSGGA